MPDFRTTRAWMICSATALAEREGLQRGALTGPGCYHQELGAITGPVRHGIRVRSLAQLGRPANRAVPGVHSEEGAASTAEEHEATPRHHPARRPGHTQHRWKRHAAK